MLFASSVVLHPAWYTRAALLMIDALAMVKYRLAYADNTYL